MLIDSHAHINFEAFNDNWREIASDCLSKDIWVINVGAQLETTKKGIDIANIFDAGMYASVGLHPIHVEGSKFHPEDFDIDQYAKLVESSDKVVAIGETGIDFFHDDNIFPKQQEVFRQHIELAQRFNLPMIIHGRNSRDGSRSAYKEILNIIKEYPGLKGVAHCFGGDQAEADGFLELGFHLGFTGVVTFKNAKDLQQIAKNIPIEKILIETDAPYLAPEPHRGKENKPQYVKYVAEKLAELREVDYTEIAKNTTKNATELFLLS